MTVFHGHSEDGRYDKKISSKRVITFLFTITFIFVIVSRVAFGALIEEFMFNGLVNIIIWSMGFIGSEQFVGTIKNKINGDQGSQDPVSPSIPSSPPRSNIEL